MAANLNESHGLADDTLARLYPALDQMSEGLEVLNAELVVASLRRGAPLTPWTHERLSAIAAALDELREAVDTSPRRAG